MKKQDIIKIQEELETLKGSVKNLQMMLEYSSKKLESTKEELKNERSKTELLELNVSSLTQQKFTLSRMIKSLEEDVEKFQRENAQLKMRSKGLLQRLFSKR